MSLSQTDSNSTVVTIQLCSFAITFRQKQSSGHNTALFFCYHRQTVKVQWSKYSAVLSLSTSDSNSPVVTIQRCSFAITVRQKKSSSHNTALFCRYHRQTLTVRWSQYSAVLSLSPSDSNGPVVTIQRCSVAITD